MGTRTLVVSPRPDGRFDCRYAHWGVGVDPLAASRPLGRAWSAAAVLAELDAGYDRLVVAGPPRRRYCICWLDPTLTDSDDIALARTDDPAALRAWWTTAKSRTVDAVAGGVAAGAARAGLVAALRRRADAVHVDDASFLFDGG
jgi:hypothetical protein